MALPKLTKLELQIMEALWNRGALSIREIQEAFPQPRPAYNSNNRIPAGWKEGRPSRAENKQRPYL